jgi:hypothetical protein
MMQLDTDQESLNFPPDLILIKRQISATCYSFTLQARGLKPKPVGKQPKSVPVSGIHKKR